MFNIGFYAERIYCATLNKKLDKQTQAGYIALTIDNAICYSGLTATEVLKEVASYIERVEALDKYDKEISKYTLEYLLIDLEFYSNHELYSNGYQAEKLRAEIKNRLTGLYK